MTRLGGPRFRQPFADRPMLPDMQTGRFSVDDYISLSLHITEQKHIHASKRAPSRLVTNLRRAVSEITGETSHVRAFHTNYHRPHKYHISMSWRQV